MGILVEPHRRISDVKAGINLVGSQIWLFLGQCYLLWLLLTARASFSQIMLLNCAEAIFAAIVTTLFFSRSWRGFGVRLGELLGMLAFTVVFMFAFGLVELLFSDSALNGAAQWTRAMTALISGDGVRYGLLYIAITAAAWLLLAAISGNAKSWWVMNVARQISVTFGALVGAWVATIVLLWASGFASAHFAASAHTVAMVRRGEAAAILVLFCMLRMTLSWVMQTQLTPDDMRQIEQKYFFETA